MVAKVSIEVVDNLIASPSYMHDISTASRNTNTNTSGVGSAIDNRMVRPSGFMTVLRPFSDRFPTVFFPD